MSEYTDDIEEETLEVDEEEEEDDNSFEIEDEPDPEDLAELSKFRLILLTYNAFIYQYPATSSSPGSFQLIIPSNFLPLYQQSVYGFNIHPTLLEVKIELDNFKWNKMPKMHSLLHPVYKKNFIGSRLIENVIHEFFSQSYKPREKYKSAAYIISHDDCKANQKLLKKLEQQGFDLQKASSALILSHNNLHTALNFLKTGNAPPEATEIKVSFSESPLIYLVLELCEVFLDLSDHCCVCRAKLSIPTIRPCPCENQVCQMSFTEIGFGASLIAEIRRDPNAADFLISCCSAAVGTEFLEPAPPNISVAELKKIFAELPPVCDLADCQDDKQLCSLIGIDAYKLLRWIILSNRSQFISLPEELRMKQFPPKKQFLTLISSAEKERKFRELRAKHGSLFLWYCSTPERWHSIIRNDLHIDQYESYFGKGIHFECNSYRSSLFSHAEFNNYKNTKIENDQQVIGLCEVAKVPKLSCSNKRFTIINEDSCIVRFIFVGEGFSHDTTRNPPKDIPKFLDVLKYHANSQRLE